MYRIILPLAVFVLLSLVATDAIAAEDQERAGDLQPLAPLTQVRLVNFQNYGNQGNFAVSTDGRTLAMPQGNGFTLFDLTKNANPYQYRQPRFVMVEGVNLYNCPMAFAPDGKTLVVAQSQNPQDAAIRFIDLNSGKEVRQIDNDQPFFGLAISSDGKMVALSSQQRVEVWDAASGDEIQVFQGAANTTYPFLAFSPDGKMLATAGTGQTVQLWEIATGKQRQEFQVDVESPMQPGRVYYPGSQIPLSTVALSPDGKVLAVAAGDHGIHLWDLLTGEQLPPLVGHQDMVRALTFSPDCKRLFSVDNGGLKLVWSVARLERPPVDKLASPSAGEFDELWNDLAEADAFQTYRAVRHLLAEPQRTLPLLRQHLQAVPAGDAKRIEKLISDLQNPKAGTRRKAMAELCKLGEAALGALSQLPDNQKQSIPVFQMMIHKLEMQYSSPDHQRAIKAVRVLEQIDGDEARQLLEKLANGAPGAKLTVAAKFALARHKEAGSQAATARTPRGAGRIPKDGLTSQELEALWKDLASEEAPKAYQAIKRLRAVPGQSVSLLRDRSHPEKPVAAQEITRLITELDSKQFAARQKATRDLENLEELAAPALRQTLENGPSLEMRRRIEALLNKMDQHTPSSEHLRALRTIEVLEGIGTTEARAVLATLGKGAPQARLTQLATAAQERLGKRSVAAR